MEELSQKVIVQSFITESTELLETIWKQTNSLKDEKNLSKTLSSLIKNLKSIQANAHLLDFSTIEQLSLSLSGIYTSIKDDQIKISDRIIRFTYLILQKITKCLSLITEKASDKTDIVPYVTYCDKISDGELFDIDAVEKEINNFESENEFFEDEEDRNKNISEIQSVRIKFKSINDIITSFDDMIIKEFRLKHQLDNLKEIEEQTENRTIKAIRKQLEYDINTLETTIFSVQQQVFDLRMMPISIVLKLVQTQIDVEALKHGKKVNVDIPATSINLDKIILETLSDILSSLIKNSFEHGLESAEERVKNGKPENGNISITCKSDSKHVEIIVKDDGSGIDYESIREKAREIYPERREEIEKMNDRELSSFLFMNDFSKEDEASEELSKSSLNSVWISMEKIKGHISISSEKGKYTAFTLKVPLSLATLQGFFITSNQDKYLIPTQHITDIIYKKKNEFMVLQNQTYTNQNGNLIPIYSLSSLFKNQKVAEAVDSYTILIVEYLDQQIGIIVEDVQRFASLVVKPLPASFKNFKILQGIVFDEHYDIVPILHVPDVIMKLKSLRGYDLKKYEANTKAKTYNILIVDDSDTTIQIEKAILSSDEYFVTTAKDGIEAMDHLRESQFDLVITDKDMPRMNGMVLLENMRLMENYKKVPVIILCSHVEATTESDFLKAGADVFLTKSDFKRSTLLNTVKELLSE